MLQYQCRSQLVSCWILSSYQQPLWNHEPLEKRRYNKKQIATHIKHVFKKTLVHVDRQRQDECYVTKWKCSPTWCDTHPGTSFLLQTKGQLLSDFLGWHFHQMTWRSPWRMSPASPLCSCFEHSTKYKIYNSRTPHFSRVHVYSLNNIHS